MVQRRSVELIWRLIVGGVFLHAAITKFLGGVHWEQPRSIYEVVVYGRPWLHYLLVGAEAGLGLWMISGLLNRWAAAVTLIVLLGFSGVIAREVWQRTPRACGCNVVQVFPDEDPAAIRRGLIHSLGRNGILMAASAWLCRRGFTQPRKQAPDPQAA